MPRARAEEIREAAPVYKRDKSADFRRQDNPMWTSSRSFLFNTPTGQYRLMPMSQLVRRRTGESLLQEWRE